MKDILRVTLPTLSFNTLMKDILAIAAWHFVFHRLYEGHFNNANLAFWLSSTHEGHLGYRVSAFCPS